VRGCQVGRSGRLGSEVLNNGRVVGRPAVCLVGVLAGWGPTGGLLVGVTFPTLGDDMTVGSPSAAGAIGFGTCIGALDASADAAMRGAELARVKMGTETP
jgi:hypothetical protein